jgi:hypothetical protein
MIFTTGLYHRSIPSQSDMAFSTSINLSNTKGVFDISITGGDYNQTLFKFSSGKIFDIAQRHVWAYNPEQEVQISGNIGLDYFNYFINGSPVCLYYPLSNTNYYEGVNLNFNNVSGEGSIEVVGKRPEYNLEFSKSEYLATEDLDLNIQCLETDPNRDFKILSGSIFSDSVAYGIGELLVGKPIDINSPLKFLITGSPIPYLTGDVDITLTTDLFTNFGLITGDFHLKILKVPIYYTEWLSDFSGILNSATPPSTVFQNYELRSVYPEDRNVYVEFKFLDGYTGLYSGLASATGEKYSFLSGFIQGYDYISGYSFIPSGVYTDLQGNTQTGFISGVDNVKIYPTGLIVHQFKFPAASQKLYKQKHSNVSIPGTGVIKTALEPTELFLLGGDSRALNEETPFSGYADISGIYRGVMNYASNVLYSGTFPSYYTGYFDIDDSNFLWTARYVTGQGFSGEAINKIYVDGLDYTMYNASYSTMFTSGRFSSTVYQTRYFDSGDYLESAIFYKNNLASCEFLSFGLPTNVNQQIFLGQNYSPITNQTGYVGGIKLNTGAGSYFKDGLLTHYKLDVDIESPMYPFIFLLERSADGNSWESIDSRSGQNFYPAGTRYFKLPEPSDIYTYPYYRINLISGKTWPHSSSYPGDRFNLKSGQSYGLRQFDLYEGVPVKILDARSFLDKIPLVYSGINNYELKSSGNYTYPDYVESGRVVMSEDSNIHPAWLTFSSTGYSDIYTNIYGDSYVGFYKFSSPSVPGIDRKDINSFSLQFVEGRTPKYLQVSYLDSLGAESELYSNDSPTQNESGFFEPVDDVTGIYIFRFNKKTNPFGFNRLKNYGFSGLYTGDSTIKSPSFYLKQELLPKVISAVSGGTYFGESLAVSDNGNYLFVGAPSYDTLSGMVYGFTRNAEMWSDQGVDIITSYPPSFSSNYRFGTSVHTNGDASVLAIGAKSKVDTQGAIYLYGRVGGGLIYSYVTGFSGNYYGDKCFLNNSGNVLIVPKTGLSSVDVFYRIFLNNNPERWAFSQTLSPAPNSDPGFGFDLDMSLNSRVLAIGHPYDSSFESGAGSVYLYSGFNSGSGFSYTGVGVLSGDGIINSSPYVRDNFGHSLSMNDAGTALCVAGPSDYAVSSSATRSPGAIWVFNRDLSSNLNDFNFIQKLYSPGGDSRLGEYGVGFSSLGDFILASSKYGPVIFSGDKPIDSPAASWSYLGRSEILGVDNNLYSMYGTKIIKNNPFEVYLSLFKKNYDGAGKVSVLSFGGFDYTDFKNPNFVEVFN